MTASPLRRTSCQARGEQRYESQIERTAHNGPQPTGVTDADTRSADQQLADEEAGEAGDQTDREDKSPDRGQLRRVVQASARDRGEGKTDTTVSVLARNNCRTETNSGDLTEVEAEERGEHGVEIWLARILVPHGGTAEQGESHSGQKH